MALLNEASVRMVNQLSERFHFSSKDQRRLIVSLSLNKVLDKLVQPLSAAEVFALLRSLSIEELLFMRSLSKNLAARRRLDKYILKWRQLKLQINGNDLRALGISPGQKMKIVLDQVLFALAEGKCLLRSEQLDYARSLCF